MPYLEFEKAIAVEYTKYDRYGRIAGRVMVSAPEACRDAQLRT